jgi:hypothetical protein
MLSLRIVCDVTVADDNYTTAIASNMTDADTGGHFSSVMPDLQAVQGAGEKGRTLEYIAPRRLQQLFGALKPAPLKEP